MLRKREHIIRNSLSRLIAVTREPLKVSCQRLRLAGDIHHTLNVACRDLADQLGRGALARGINDHKIGTRRAVLLGRSQKTTRVGGVAAVKARPVGAKPVKRGIQASAGNRLGDDFNSYYFPNLI